MFEGINSVALSCKILIEMKKIGTPVTAEDLSKKVKYPTDEIEQYLKSMDEFGFVERNQTNNTYTINKSIKPLFYFPFSRLNL